MTDHLSTEYSPKVADLTAAFQMHRSAAVDAINHVKWRMFAGGVTLHLLQWELPHGAFTAYCQQRLSMPKRTAINWKNFAWDTCSELAKSAKMAPLIVDSHQMDSHEFWDELYSKLQGLAENPEFIEAFKAAIQPRQVSQLTSGLEAAPEESPEPINNKAIPLPERKIMTEEERLHQMEIKFIDYFDTIFIPQMSEDFLVEKKLDYLPEKNLQDLEAALQDALREVRLRLGKKK